jgi:hypothetical protein
MLIRAFMVINIPVPRSQKALLGSGRNARRRRRRRRRRSSTTGQQRGLIKR